TLLKAGSAVTRRALLDEREAEKSMDGYLKTQGLHRKKIAKDGSCLFRAVAEQVLHNQGRHTEVRAKCVEFLKENRGSYEAFIEGDFEDYLLKLQDPQQWVGEVEINALAVIYKRDFFIFQEPGKPAVNITDNNFKDTVRRLCFLNGNHYDSVYAVSHIQAAALCQSILYELLYDGVFGVERGALGSCQRSSRPADLLSDDAMNACVSSDDSDLEAGEPLWYEARVTLPLFLPQRRGRGRLLPERVRRSLNPTLLRNVEYDVWHKSKRAQQKMDYCIAAGMQFTVGDRCQVRLEGRSHSAVIKEVSPNNGPVSVYLEELGSRKQVPLWSLRPPSEENSWSTVVNRGDKKGRNVASASSSFVSPATAPGASGRVQKQHSWPPQATVEEQAGAKGVRCRQRSAREVEEKNTALVEIQLRDENSFPVLGVRSLHFYVFYIYK
uniref:ubiquitinyl hydrolase 1 n=1 Tax=Gasterosteus aculeatus aculeatus TaxID=481459 RepID=A0AAQ4QJT5_GASAC